MMLTSVTMATWIVHDRRMPGWPSVLDRVRNGPAIDVAGGNVVVAVVCDIVLFACFGLVHLLFARRWTYVTISQKLKLLPQPALRTAFITATAMAWVGLMLLWQPTSLLVFDLRPTLSGIGIAASSVDKYGPLIPFVFMLLCWGTVFRHGALRFFGMRQLASPDKTNELGEYQDGAKPKLVTTGEYRIVRHPMYTYLLASVVVRPVLSLDLLVWLLSAIGFLIIALPYEEEKLIAKFGDQYREYQERVPAFVPFWPHRQKSRPTVYTAQ
jgi:protein-S-isoprenylcysteine O-methyltransferase Ste14